MIKIIQKTFLEALSLLSTDPDKARSYLQDKRLTQAERSILQGHFHLRNNQIEKMLNDLQSIKGEMDRVVKSQYCLLMGMGLCNQSKFKEAIPFFEQSLKLMKEDLPYFSLTTLVNLFLVYFNLKDKEHMTKLIAELEKFPVSNPIGKMRVLQCRFNYHSFLNETLAAKSLLEKISELSDDMPDADKMSHLICKFDFYIKLDDIENCYKTLEEMKSHRKFHLTQNYQYMKLLLNHYSKNAPLYFYDHEFEDHPVLFNQIKVIQQLEEGNLSKAQEHWSRLKALYPDLYGEVFEFRGGKTLFAICLQKYSEAKTSEILEADSAGNILENLHAILKNSKTPIRKELLFEMLWGRSPEDKDDLMKLTRSIYRVRTRFGLDIKTRKGSYFVEIPSKKSKAS